MIEENSDLLVANSYTFAKPYISRIEADYFTKNQYPIVYIIYDQDQKIAYVGESTNAINRMNNHLSHPEKKNLKYLYIISSSRFNKSATLDIESNLIKYMSADGSYKLLNGNAGLAEHNYYQKDFYYEMFKDIWKNLRLQEVVTKDILDIDNSDLFKYSPYKSLSSDQHQAIQKYLKIILGAERSTVFVEGSAGTGKTVLAVYLIKLLLSDIDLQDYDELEGDSLEELFLVKEIKEKNGKDLHIGLVVPMTPLRNTLKSVFRNIRGLKVSLVIGASEVLKKDYDLLIVDEAHRLRQRKAITNYRSFDNNNRALGLDNSGTELDWILRRSRHQLFFYDPAQSVRPSDVPKERFNEIKAKEDTLQIQLTSQLRVKGGTDYIKFIDKLLHLKIPEGEDKFESDSYDLKLFSSLGEMVREMQKKEDKFGLCRMIAGYSWKWISKDSDLPDAVIDGIELTWNRVAHDWINSTTNLNEIGCIHTTQGYDLNYAGIIFGEEITYNEETEEIEIIKKNYHDKKGSQGVSEISDLKEYIINIYKTIMYRGIRGTYVYVCDPHLREYFKRYIPQHHE